MKVYFSDNSIKLEFKKWKLNLKHTWITTEKCGKITENVNSDNALFI